MTFRQNILTMAFVLAVSSLGYSPAASQTCRWAGTAPYCAGECGIGETEEARATEGGSVQHLPSENFFGNTCIFGTKAYCCKTPGVTCRWDGTAPFCEGECNADENAVKQCASCIGKTCWTGSKVKCCRATGSIGQPLQANVGDARYAAIWEKKSGPASVARHGMTSAQYQAEYDKLTANGYRLVHVSGYGVGSTDYYAAIWEKKSGPAWTARHRMTFAKFQETFNELGEKGYRLVHVSGYGVGSTDYYAAIWEKKSGPAWAARHGMTSAQYQAEYNKLTQKGYRLVHVSGYGVGSKDYYAAIWEKKSGPAWVARHGMTSAKFQETFNELGEKGYRLVHISGYSVGGKHRYAAIWEKKSGLAWVARFGMTSSQYQEEFNYLAKDGYRLSIVSGFHAY